MPLCTLLACSSSIPTFVYLAAAGLLSTTATWVASKTRSTSEAALSISRDQERLLSLLAGRPTRSESLPVARDRRKSSSKRITSTSRSRHPSTGSSTPPSTPPS